MTSRLDTTGRRWLVAGLAVAAAAFAGARDLWSGNTAPVPEAGIALLMFDSPVCEHCELWDEEIGVVYHKTPEGRFAPLRRLTPDSPAGAVGALRPIVYTPTFVVVKNGREVGRITGYPGEDFFWPMLADILRRVGFRQPS